MTWNHPRFLPLLTLLLLFNSQPHANSQQELPESSSGAEVPNDYVEDASSVTHQNAAPPPAVGRNYTFSSEEQDGSAGQSLGVESSRPAVLDGIGSKTAGNEMGSEDAAESDSVGENAADAVAKHQDDVAEDEAGSEDEAEDDGVGEPENAAGAVVKSQDDVAEEGADAAAGTTEPAAAASITSPPAMAEEGADDAAGTTEPAAADSITTPPAVAEEGADAAAGTTEPAEADSITSPPAVAGSTSTAAAGVSRSAPAGVLYPLPADLPTLQWRQRVGVTKCCGWSDALVRRPGSSAPSCEPISARHRWRPLLLSGRSGRRAPPGEHTSISPPADTNTTCSSQLLWLDSAFAEERFELLTTGHLYMTWSDALLPPGSFCADRLLTPAAGAAAADDAQLHVDSYSSSVGARVCLPSLQQQTSLLNPDLLRPACVRGLCLRKCCPRGLKVVRDSQECVPQTGEYPWSPAFHHELTQPVDDLAYTTVAGNPECRLANGSHGKVFPLEPAYKDEDKFYLQLDGRLWVPEQDITFELPDFCVDQVEYFYQGRKVDYHLAIVCFGDTAPKLSVVSYIYRGLLMLSVFCLLLTLLAYALVPELQNLHGKCLMSHVSALLTAYVCVIVAQLEAVYSSGPTCQAIALVMYFSFVAACFWLNAMSFDIWLTFSRLRSATPGGGGRLRRFLRYSVYCWCSALLLTVLLAVMQFIPDHLLPPEQVIRPKLGDRSCWFPAGVPMLVYFHLPLLVLMLANLVLFILTARNLLKAERDTRMAARKKKGTERFKIYVNLFIVMGITWIAEALSNYMGPSEMWFVTDVVNALQGFFIFILFTMREATRRTIARRLLSSRFGRWCRCCARPLQMAVGNSQKTNSTAVHSDTNRQHTAPRQPPATTSM